MRAATRGVSAPAKLDAEGAGETVPEGLGEFEFPFVDELEGGVEFLGADVVFDVAGEDALAELGVAVASPTGGAGGFDLIEGGLSELGTGGVALGVGDGGVKDGGLDDAELLMIGFVDFFPPILGFLEGGAPPTPPSSE